MKKPFLFFLFFILFSSFVLSSVQNIPSNFSIYVSNTSLYIPYAFTGFDNPYTMYDNLSSTTGLSCGSDSSNTKILINFTLDDYYQINSNAYFSTKKIGSNNDVCTSNIAKMYLCINDYCWFQSEYMMNITQGDYVGSQSNSKFFKFDFNVNDTSVFNKIKLEFYPSYEPSANPDYCVAVDEFLFNLTKYDGYIVSPDIPNNTLPTFKVLYNDSIIYFNNTLGYSQFDFKIVTNDTEDDRILYSINSISDQKILDYISFDNPIYHDDSQDYNKYSNVWYLTNCLILDRAKFWGLCSNDIIYGVTLDTTPLDNNLLRTNCSISNSVNGYDNTLSDILITVDNIQGYSLYVNTSCNLPIDIAPTTTVLDNFGMDIYLHPNNNSIISYYITRSLMNEHDIPFYINRTSSSGNLTIDYNSTTIFNQDLDSIRFSMVSLFNESKSKLYIYDINYTLRYYDNNFPLSSNTYFFSTIQNIQGNFTFDDILYFEDVMQGNWSTTYDTPLKFYNTGYQEITFYVTDDKHQSVFTNKKTISIQVLPEYFETNSIKDQVPFKALFFIKEWLIDWGVLNDIYSIMWFVELWFIFVLVIIDRENILRALLVSSSLFVVFGLVGLTDISQILGNLVLVALSLTPQISKIWGNF